MRTFHFKFNKREISIDFLVGFHFVPHLQVSTKKFKVVKFWFLSLCVQNSLRFTTKVCLHGKETQVFREFNLR